MSRIVIALGGNALGNDYLEQQKLLEEAAPDLIKLFKGNEVVITHGNGPQVGMITKSFEESNIEMPLDCATAMSEGYIGFHIQEKIKQELEDNNIDRDVVTLVTEVLVDEKDPSFKNPTKPIGKFYTKEEADKLSKETGDIYKEDSNRGYRKVVASPKPIDIENVESIENLLEEDVIVVACGGGGIPVVDDDTKTKVEAVIDKDFASSLLAQKLNADKFIVLTAVKHAKVNFGMENECDLEKVTPKMVEDYINNNEFGEGSMLPKVKACLEFTNKTGNDSIITSLDNIKGIIEDKDITTITNNL